MGEQGFFLKRFLEGFLKSFEFPEPNKKNIQNQIRSLVVFYLGRKNAVPVFVGLFSMKMTSTSRMVQGKG